MAATPRSSSPSNSTSVEQVVGKPTDSQTIALGAAASGAAPTLANTAAGTIEPTREPLPKLVDADRWQEYADIGLPRPATRAAQRVIVSMYRLLGLGILTLIVVVLVGYLALTVFYFFNRSWVAPVAISQHDERVVTLQTQLAEQHNERARLAGELDQAERAITVEQAFHAQFIRAIQKDLEGRKVALQYARRLSSQAAATRHEIRTTNGDYSVATVARMSDDYAAGMIDRQAMLAGKFHLAQISAANLTLAERQSEFDQRAADLAVQTRSLDAILANESATAALSYDILRIVREYEASKLVLARELANRDRLKASVGRTAKIIEGLEQSAYLRALADGATVAFIPYENLHKVEKETPLYACALEMLVCREVGKVLEVLPGEVRMHHPNRDSAMRGRMVEMQMSEPDAARDMVLFAGSPPLGF